MRIGCALGALRRPTSERQRPPACAPPSCRSEITGVRKRRRLDATRVQYEVYRCVYIWYIIHVTTLIFMHACVIRVHNPHAQLHASGMQTNLALPDTKWRAADTRPFVESFANRLEVPAPRGEPPRAHAQRRRTLRGGLAPDELDTTRGARIPQRGTMPRATSQCAAHTKEIVRKQDPARPGRCRLRLLRRRPLGLRLYFGARDLPEPAALLPAPLDVDSAPSHA